MILLGDNVGENDCALSGGHFAQQEKRMGLFPYLRCLTVCHRWFAKLRPVPVALSVTHLSSHLQLLFEQVLLNRR
jgi:hypothetical protein